MTIGLPPPPKKCITARDVPAVRVPGVGTICWGLAMVLIVLLNVCWYSNSKRHYGACPRGAMIDR